MERKTLTCKHCVRTPCEMPVTTDNIRSLHLCFRSHNYGETHFDMRRKLPMVLSVRMCVTLVDHFDFIINESSHFQYFDATLQAREGGGAGWRGNSVGREERSREDVIVFDSRQVHDISLACPNGQRNFHFIKWKIKLSRNIWRSIQCLRIWCYIVQRNLTVMLFPRFDLDFSYNLCGITWYSDISVFGPQITVCFPSVPQIRWKHKSFTIVLLAIQKWVSGNHSQILTQISVCLVPMETGSLT